MTLILFVCARSRNFVRVLHSTSTRTRPAQAVTEGFSWWFSSVHGRLSQRLGEHMTESAPRLWYLTGTEIELDGGPTFASAINVSDADANVRALVPEADIGRFD